MKWIGNNWIFFMMVFVTNSACSKTNTSEIENLPNNRKEFIFLNLGHLKKVKDLIKAKNTYFLDAYNQLITEANKELEKTVNPVTLKTQIPPSGDVHDYLSIAPYWWPDPTTQDGFPWISKDGQVNPMTRGDDTDQVRLSNMFDGLDILSMAYFFSDDTKYAKKAGEVIKIWFIDNATKVNPNVNFGQGVPRSVTGRSAGIIEWTGISNLITTLQLLLSDNLMPDVEKTALNSWLSDYYKWLSTSELGTADDKGTQNHANWYDFQMVGLARYLGLETEAKTRVEAAKIKRIAQQIEPDGSQPQELRRTKSVYYSEMNLRAMTLVAEMGKPLGVDLWNYSTSDGRSLRKAFDYLRPYTLGERKWTYQQITSGGAEKAIEDRLKPLFSMASTIYGEELIDQSANTAKHLSYLQQLQYPPLSMLK